MRVHYCWKCRREVPMFDGRELAYFYELYHRYSAPVAAAAMEGRKVPRDEYDAMLRPMLDEYERFTGMRYIEPKEIFHHDLARFGPPCPRCGRLFRTPRASKCMECGNPRSMDAGSVDAKDPG